LGKFLHREEQHWTAAQEALGGIVEDGPEGLGTMQSRQETIKADHPYPSRQALPSLKSPQELDDAHHLRSIFIAAAH
jgi:hypothetical protein